MPSRYRNYVLDTNLLRPLTDSRNDFHVTVRAYYSRVNRDCLWIPVVAVVESLRGGVNNIKDSDSDKDANRKYDLFLTYYDFLKQHQILPLAGDSTAFKSASAPKGVRDRRIAASALARGFTIATADVDDFLAIGVPQQFVVDWTVDPQFALDIT